MKQEKATGSKRIHTGLILTVTASVFTTLCMVTVKILVTRQYDPFNLCMWRYFGITAFGLALTLYFQYWKKSSPFTSLWSQKKTLKENWTINVWLWLSHIAAASTYTFLYLSLNYLTVADSTAIYYSGLVVVVFLAHFFLNEKFGITSILIALWTFLGVFAISRPPILTGQEEFNPEALLGTGLALGGMVSGSICIILRRHAREIQFSLVILSSGIWGSVQSGILAYSVGNVEVPRELEDSLLFLGMAGLAFLSVLCIILAVKFEQAGPYALIRSSDILFAFLWQFIFLSVIPDLVSIIGALIVLIGILLSTFRKWIKTLPEGNRTKRMFSFLLR